MSLPPRFSAAIAAIDEANAHDPNVVTFEGVESPKELLHARMVSEWVQRLDPDATEAQLLAARAHHLRRWSIPRTDHPEGRAGYLRWRSALSRQHAEEVAALLVGAGYDDATVARVQAIIRKENLRGDEQVQTHEDALCLVFLQTQLGDLHDRLGTDKTVDVLARTVPKMSEQALLAASSLPLPPEQAALLAEAVASAAAADPLNRPTP